MYSCSRFPQNTSGGAPVFSKAGMGEAEEIFALLRRARADLDAHGIFQWDDYYPSRENVCEDIKAGCLYTYRASGMLSAVFTYNRECDTEEYKNAVWTDPAAPFMVIHRLCVEPGLQGHGIGTAVLEYIIGTLTPPGTGYIRLDTFAKNPHAIELYGKFGFSVVGSAEWEPGTFLIMEKKV